MKFNEVHILIIDDSPMTRSIIKQCLIKFGTYNVFEADNGMAGIEMVEACRPDLILCDLSMEPINGFEFVSLLRKQKKANVRNIPVIILTTHDEETYVTKATGLDIQGYLLKPISPNILGERITQVMDKIK